MPNCEWLRCLITGQNISLSDITEPFLYFSLRVLRINRILSGGSRSVPLYSYWSLTALFYWAVKSLSYWFSLSNCSLIQILPFQQQQQKQQ
ncbi:hypothetical protein T03_7652 [Trichinella britovi]|uniref:Uncharacterized protein n=1 Tax=Trichinella britovi TaxID=45882 RepID=A0A0V1D506_TRIBR|nr:hypothetical protein T03_7652 [Trichinella britovi]